MCIKAGGGGARRRCVWASVHDGGGGGGQHMHEEWVGGVAKVRMLFVPHIVNFL